MKKMFFLILLLCLTFSACNWKTDVTNQDIPTHYQTLEFWNGGGKIASYENVTMKVEVVTTNNIVGADINFYKYHVTGNNVDDWIIDSESLALKYTL